jgi:hypothetical protein
MLHLITTAFILAGGLVGIALGLYGLAPAFFQGRLERLRRFRLATAHGWDDDPGMYEIDGADEDDDYLAAVDALQHERGAFGLPSAWQHAAPASPAPFLEEVEAHVRSPNLGDDVEANEPEPAALALSAATRARLELDKVLRGPEPGDEDEEVLEIFREVLPAGRTAQGRARSAAMEGMDSRDVRMRDLLAELRWTLRTLPRPREAPQR